MASVRNMSDAELRRRLVEYGFSVGPITPTTRKLYEDKLISYYNTPRAGPYRQQSSASVRMPQNPFPVCWPDDEARGLLYQQPRPQQQNRMSTPVESLPDAVLRRKLLGYCYPVGPVTVTTRKVLERKLAELIAMYGDRDFFPNRLGLCPTESDDTLDFLKSMKTPSNPPVPIPSVPVPVPPVPPIPNVQNPMSCQRGCYPYMPMNFPFAMHMNDPPSRDGRRGYSSQPFHLNVGSLFLRADTPAPRLSAFITAYNLCQTTVQDLVPICSSLQISEHREDSFQQISSNNDNKVLVIKCIASPVLIRLNDFRKTNQFCDIIVKVADKEFCAHKNVLSAFSPFFEAMFSGAFIEAHQPAIELMSIEPSIMEIILDYAYAKSVEVSELDVLVVLQAASFFQADSLVEACCEYLLKNISNDNCLNVFTIAHLLARAALQDTVLILHEKVKHYVVSNFPTLSQQSDFLDIDVDLLVEIISDDSLNSGTEESVLEAVISWFRHRKEERLPLFDQVLRHVRLVYLNVWFILDRADREGFASSPACKQLIEEASLFHSLPSRRLDVLSSIRKHRRSSPNVEVMLVHDICSETRLESLGCFTEDGEKVASLKCPPKIAGVLAVSTYKNTILCRHSEEIWRYDFECKTWRQTSPMLRPRVCFGLCELDDYWYTVGGAVPNGYAKDTVEKYDLPSNSWREMASTPVQISQPAVVCYKGLIFALGGITPADVGCNLVLQYDPRTNAWIILTTMPVAMKSPSACVLDGNIYVFSEDYPKRVVIYNVSSDQWDTRDEVPHPFYAGPAIISGNIYILTKQAPDSAVIVRYSPSTDIWQEIAKYTDFQPRLFGGALIMKRPRKME